MRKRYLASSGAKEFTRLAALVLSPALEHKALGR
jgi:hypothetical protein